MENQRQKLLLAVLAIGGIGYLAYTYVYSPRAAAVAELEARLETLETQNAAARRLMATQGGPDAERRLGLYREQLTRVEGLIPSSEELPDLLDAISAEAQRTGVELALIQPVGAVAESYYTRRTYDIAILGRYHQIGAFLTAIGSLPRIVTPVDLQLATRGEPTTVEEPRLEARFSIETYVLPAGGVPADTTHVE